MKKGAYDYITKPFSRVDLVKTIRQALDKQEILEENRILREKLAKLENKEIVKALLQKFLPESILVNVNSKEQLESLCSYPFFTGKEFSNKTSVFVCKDFTCSLPLESISEIEKLL